MTKEKTTFESGIPGVTYTVRSITCYEIVGQGKHCHSKAKLNRMLKQAQCARCRHYVPERYRGDKPDFDDYHYCSEESQLEFWGERFKWWKRGCKAGVRGGEKPDSGKWWSLVDIPCPGFGVERECYKCIHCNPKGVPVESLPCCAVGHEPTFTLGWDSYRGRMDNGCDDFEGEG